MSGRSRITCAWVLALLALIVVAPVPASAGAAASAAGPSVTMTVVGPHGTLFGPRMVDAAATAVAVAGRRCLIAAGTPLAALSAAYGVGGPGFSLHDYGACSRNPADAGQLFVTAVGAFANRGTSGWEYTVDGRPGTTGAADTSGPFGNGRLLRSGDRVVWFWCAMSPNGTCRR